MTAYWNIQSHLPPQEPNLHNMNAYLKKDLLSGSSADAQFVFDAIYSIEHESFVFTMMQVDNFLGFIDKEARLYPKTRVELLQVLEQFKQSPETFLIQTIQAQG